ncbi:hypothetical protein [Burkholderia cenocepacia]|uniref:hypothetical protein n=1 Tax=Burkholderia cenocepacia TaxID=95486 RepID=UPI002AB6A6EF|nr:hypothetical protein [Burkholderia cenocepacia]
MATTNNSVGQQVTARQNLLKDVASTPAKYLDNQVVRKAIATQGNLAKLRHDQYGIVSMALNTLKAHANDFQSHGWSELDILRLHALKQVNSVPNPDKTPKPGTKADLANRVLILTKERDNALEDLKILTDAVYRAMRNARSYASDSHRTDLIQRCAQDEVELRAMLSVLHAKLGDSR